MDWDNAWKEVLTHLFKDFLDFFFPEIYRDIDFSRGYVFLDKELGKIIKSGKVGTRIVDKLVKVYLKNGEEKWLLIHIEIQGYKDEKFAERMFIYNYRIYDRYHKEVISLAILTDSDVTYKPDEFRITRWGFECKFKFPMVKLLDYQNEFDHLTDKTNPFNIIVKSYLKTLDTMGDRQERFSWKKSFLIDLYNSGMIRETIIAVYKFIDWIMELPEELEEKILDEIYQLQEEKKMSVLTTAEKRGLKQGIEQGTRQGIYQTIADILEIKFGAEALELMEKIRKISDIKILNNIRIELKKAETLVEAQEALLKILSNNNE